MNKLYMTLCLALAACYANNAHATKSKKINKNSIVYRQAQQVKALKKEKEETDQREQEQFKAELLARDQRNIAMAVGMVKSLAPSIYSAPEEFYRYDRALSLLAEAADGKEDVSYALRAARDYCA